MKLWKIELAVVIGGITLEGKSAKRDLLKRNSEIDSKRKSMVSTGDRSAKIRTYNYPQGRVTDHRINLTLYNLNDILNGDINKLIDELTVVENTQRLKEGDYE